MLMLMMLTDADWCCLWWLFVVTSFNICKIVRTWFTIRYRPQKIVSLSLCLALKPNHHRMRKDEKKSFIAAASHQVLHHTGTLLQHQYNTNFTLFPLQCLAWTPQIIFVIKYNGTWTNSFKIDFFSPLYPSKSFSKACIFHKASSWNPNQIQNKSVNFKYISVISFQILALKQIHSKLIS